MDLILRRFKLGKISLIDCGLGFFDDMVVSLLVEEKLICGVRVLLPKRRFQSNSKRFELPSGRFESSN
jgi:hypothetical protein